MRNYIHIQLCVTLGIAQIIFVAGSEPRFGEGQLVGGVPVGCRLVAIVLQCWFLVSFMWMLMKGVILYVTLRQEERLDLGDHERDLRINHCRRYAAVLTIASYGTLKYIIHSMNKLVSSLSLSLNPPSLFPSSF